MTARDDQVRVRRLIPPDAGRWRVLWEAYTAFYREDIPEGVTSLTFQRLCDGAQGMVGLVAVGGDDEPVGLAHLVFHSSTWSAIDSGYLEDLYVDPAHRGGRVARTCSTRCTRRPSRGASPVSTGTRRRSTAPLARCTTRSAR